MSSLQRLPDYLRKYVVEQDYAEYTSLEHSTWRYIMRQSRSFFKDRAVGIYLEGLRKTGISIDRIPSIAQMDECLSEFGWGAVGVEGFIPSSVFLDLLARGVLPVATDMRTIEHIGYTPAPDIVHEAAGHAPVIADPEYRKFLECYSQLAYRALISSEDIEYYEAIRYLSDIKENPDTKPEELKRANERLKATAASISHVSEAAKVARLAWWTIEYGLVGNPNDPKIYGAGLLSSIAESQACFDSKVKKIPLTLACLEQSYDITEPQPQLYICESLAQLPLIIDELEDSFSFKKGGLYGLQEMMRAKTLNTLMFESGVSASGILKSYLWNEKHQRLDFFKLTGPSQLAWNEMEIRGQGRARHPEGFSSPIGRWEAFPEIPPAKLNSTDLEKIRIKSGQRAELHFLSGFCVKGRVDHITTQNGVLLLITWKDCTVTRGSEVFFQPDWGDFDMIVGENVQSIFAGPADRLSFGDYKVGQASSSPGRSSSFTEEENKTFSCFDEIRKLRSDKNLSESQIEISLKNLVDHDSLLAKEMQWLVYLEIAEIACQRSALKPGSCPWLDQVHQRLAAISASSNPELKKLVSRGLDLIKVAD